VASQKRGVWKHSADEENSLQEYKALVAARHLIDPIGQSGRAKLDARAIGRRESIGATKPDLPVEIEVENWSGRGDVGTEFMEGQWLLYDEDAVATPEVCSCQC
jgi:hypothetical protein